MRSRRRESGPDYRGFCQLLSFDIKTERCLWIFILLRSSVHNIVRGKRSVATVNLWIGIIVMDKRSIQHKRIFRVSRHGRRERMKLRGATAVLGRVINVGIDRDTFLYRGMRDKESEGQDLG